MSDHSAEHARYLRRIIIFAIGAVIVMVAVFIALAASSIPTDPQATTTQTTTRTSQPAGDPLTNDESVAGDGDPDQSATPSPAGGNANTILNPTR